jgi:hypothetical protein
LIRGFVPPPASFGVVFGDALTRGVTKAEIELGVCVAPLSGRAVP